MRILKYKTDEGWLPLYTYVLSLFMRKSKNLGDLENRSEALENLGLTGENITSHLHDSKYLPLIQAAEDNAVNQVDKLRLDTNIEIRNIRDSISSSNIEIDAKLDKNSMLQLYEAEELRNKTLTVIRKLRADLL